MTSDNSLKDTEPLLGIIGGMGTQATARFYEVLHNLQSVASEQEYLDVLLYSKPSIPDRTAFITGKSSESPLDHLIRAAQVLDSAGASCIVIPCATSHFFYGELVKSVKIPVLNMLEETARYAKACGIKHVCLLATDGTLSGAFFHKAFDKYSIDVTVPDKSMQSDLMDMIYDVKCGKEVTAAIFESMISKLRDDGAEAVVLGCTELCVIAGSTKQNPVIINTLEVLAEAAILFFRDKSS